MKNSILSIAFSLLLFVTSKSFGQEVPIDDVIPQKTSTNLDHFGFKTGNETYGGIALVKNSGTIFGNGNSVSFFSYGQRDLTFYSGTGNIIFFPNTNYSNSALTGSGNVGIGTLNPLSKLSVNGNIRANEVKIVADISVPDYVFDPSYDLRSLQDVKDFINENKHLPEIPSESAIKENGIDLGDMNMKLLKKIEELTLYQIELLERIESMEKKISILEQNK